MLVGIDPGHGGSNTGCQYDGLIEKAYTLELGLTLRKALAAVGLDSEISRNGDDTLSLEQRAARLARCDFVLVLHVNAALPADAAKAKSLHTYVSADIADTDPGKLALGAATEMELCAPQLVRPAKASPIVCSAKADDRAHNCLLQHKPPAVLVELFFATHPLSNRWAKTPYGRASLLSTLVAGSVNAWYHHEISHPVDETDRKLA